MKQIDKTGAQRIADKVDLLEHTDRWIKPALERAEGKDVYIVSYVSSLLNDVYVVPTQDLDDLKFFQIDVFSEDSHTAESAKDVLRYLAAATYILKSKNPPKTEMSKLELIARKEKEVWDLYVRPSYE